MASIRWRCCASCCRSRAAGTTAGGARARAGARPRTRRRSSTSCGSTLAAGGLPARPHRLGSAGAEAAHQPEAVRAADAEARAAGAQAAPAPAVHQGKPPRACARRTSCLTAPTPPGQIRFGWPTSPTCPRARVPVSRRHPDRLEPLGGRLGLQSDPARESGADYPTQGDPRALAGSGRAPRLGPRNPVRQQ
jgi:hypothetical protein